MLLLTLAHKRKTEDYSYVYSHTVVKDMEEFLLEYERYYDDEYHFEPYIINCIELDDNINPELLDQLL
jgi:hypothetical protein